MSSGAHAWIRALVDIQVHALHRHNETHLMEQALAESIHSEMFQIAEESVPKSSDIIPKSLQNYPREALHPVHCSSLEGDFSPQIYAWDIHFISFWAPGAALETPR